MNEGQVAVPGRLETVAVVGNGLIGHGVAQVFATAGHRVVLIGRSAPSLQQARERITQSLDLFQAHRLLEGGDAAAALGRLQTSTRLEDAAPAQLVVEAVPEDTELKLEIFRRLDSICAPPAVLSSTSGRPASSLVERVRHRERVVAAHFWNPPQLMPLVEVCGGPETAPEVVAWLLEILEAAGKSPVQVEREIDGFIGNRLQFALLREALALWADGVATAEAIDTAVKTGFGRRLGVTGPLESADLAGLQTMHAFATFLFPRINDSAAPPRAFAEAGPGWPGGRGIYDWSRRDGEALLRARYEELFRQLAGGR
jgi:3-hydroxybutyryl-CoA dehydrogenase